MPKANQVAARAAIVSDLNAPASPHELPSRQDPRLIPVFKSKRVWNGVTTTRDGRAFVSYPGSDGPGIKLEELDADSRGTAFPDQSWHGWKPGDDTSAAFVDVNALRIGPDDALWVVDPGSTGLGKPAVAGAARLLRFDLASNSLSKVYAFTDVTRPTSFVDDVRFNGNMAYLTDAGAPGLIVLDLQSGKSRRVLDGHPSTIDDRAMRADGQVLRQQDGRELRVHADQLEVSPDGKYLYYQPSCGRLARIETRWLDAPDLSPAALAGHVDQSWVDTPTTGGTAIDADGVIYLSDTDRRRIITITPDGTIGVLIEDPRLIWSDAMWIDAEGFLWIPATQQNLTPGFTGGKQAVNYPVWIYKMKIDARPAPNDHR
jgi:sugar lactone lactonase YvrE